VLRGQRGHGKKSYGKRKCEKCRNKKDDPGKEELKGSRGREPKKNVGGTQKVRLKVGSETHTGVVGLEESKQTGCEGWMTVGGQGQLRGVNINEKGRKEGQTKFHAR